MFGFTIIRTAVIDNLQAELNELRGQHLNLHQLNKGHFNRYRHDTEELLKENEALGKELADLKRRLATVENERNKYHNKLQKYESRRK